MHRSHSEAQAEQCDGDLQLWWEFWPSEHTASCLCKLSGIFLIPVGILPYDLSVPTKTIFSRHPDTSTVWSAHMLLSSQSAGKYSCICINCPLLIQVQIKMKIQLIRPGGRLCFNLSPIQIRNNSAEASRVNLILTQCEIRTRSMVSIIKVFIFF